MAALLFDNAIAACGQVVDSALAERVETGLKEGPRTRPRYTLAQLLDPLFRLLPPEIKPAPAANPLQSFLDLVGQPRSGVRAYRYVAPSPTQTS